ncbi:MAG: hypothetical protein NTW69_16330 [Chloroflexi bacterium]|nr:hypothetical protein [Chloroflexota bacterium]
MKQTIKIHGTNIEELFTVLQRIVKSGKTSQTYQEFKDYPDGIKRTVTYNHSLKPAYRSGNKLTYTEHYYIMLSPGRQDITGDELNTNITMDGLSFEGLKVGADVFLDIESLDNWQELLDKTLAELRLLYPEPAPLLTRAQYLGLTISADEVNKQYGFMRADLDTPAPIVDTAKDEGKSAKEKTVAKPRKKKSKVITMPAYYEDAKKWVLAWEVIEPLIDGDSTLEIDYDELRPNLKARGLKFGNETIKKIILWGKSKKVLTLLKLDRKFNK